MGIFEQELDEEWVSLITEALELGIPMEEIRQLLNTTKEIIVLDST